jgi:hypothetical protein
MLHKTRQWGRSFGMCVNWVNTEAEQSIGLYVLPGLKINPCMFPNECVCFTFASHIKQLMFLAAALIDRLSKGNTPYSLWGKPSSLYTV